MDGWNGRVDHLLDSHSEGKHRDQLHTMCLSELFPGFANNRLLQRSVSLNTRSEENLAEAWIGIIIWLWILLMYVMVVLNRTHF